LLESISELVDFDDKALDLLNEDVLEFCLLVVHLVAHAVSLRSEVSPFLVKSVLSFVFILVKEVAELGCEEIVHLSNGADLD
jgi:hypothetical protein